MREGRTLTGQIAALPRPGSIGGDLLMLFSPPVNILLGAALRRISRLNPDVFDRLGKFRKAAFLIAPTEMPVAFRLEPTAGGGRVTVVRREDPRPVVARISGPLEELMGLFDGTRDADSAFFSRSIDVQGDTDAVVALHNSLEAAELTLADLLGAPRFARAPLERGLAFAVRDVLPRLRSRGA